MIHTATPTVDQLHLSPVPLHHGSDGGEIAVIETGGAVPFTVARAFTIRAPKGTVRGRHAHRQCSQFMIASIGNFDIICTDSFSTVEFRLEGADRGLFVPPGIWAEVRVASDHAVLLVICDRHYEAEDYIRNYEEFKTYRWIHGGERTQT